jgi:hypothetical protein
VVFLYQRGSAIECYSRGGPCAPAFIEAVASRRAAVQTKILAAFLVVPV